MFDDVKYNQEDSYGTGQQKASPMLTAIIMSGGVGISGRELST